ncbi:LpqB family beta-propeller domain-containing protein [Planobispora siamensis]|nr:LpqB family beta-propeller domain-containing protein [Planobispora siamensis]
MMRARKGRRPGIVGLLAAMVMATAACSVIPTGPGDVAVDDAGSGDPLDPPYARVIAMPPSPDWTPKEVVAGFQAAMASTGDSGHAVARQYLTASFLKKWDPSGEVMVYRQSALDGGESEEDTKETRVTLKGTVTGTIGQDGLYRPGDDELNEPFTLVKESAGWRIAGGHEGLMLSEADVRRAYRLVDLYFLDSKRRGLVIDQVQLPVNPVSTRAKTTVERLLEGPSSSLAGAAQTAFPPDIKLIDVTTENSRVVVNLSKGVTGSDNIAAMSAQLAGTLSELAGGSSVEVRVNGEPYYGDSALVVDAQAQLKFDPWMTPRGMQLFYMQGGALRQLDKDNVGQPVAGAAGDPAKAEGRIGLLARPAVSGHTLRQAAVLSDDRRSVSVAPLTPDGQWREWVTGNDLVTPNWDRYGSLWTVDRPGPQSSIVLRHYYDEEKQQVRPYRVAASDLDTVEVTALKVARDGVHVAVVVRNAMGEDEVKIGTVIGEGAASRIANLRTVVNAGDKQTIKDIAWKDGKSLYVLTGKSELLEASLTAGPKPLVSYPRMESITALDDVLLAGVKDDDGNRQVVYRNVPGWEPWVKDENGSTGFVPDGPSSPVFPLG